MKRLVQLLQNRLPVFHFNEKQVHVLYEPGDFYGSLVKLAESASKRIVVSSLYLGTGKLEEGFVNAILSAQQQAEVAMKPFRVGLLFDYPRSTRRDSQNRNSLTLLTRLLNNTPCNGLHNVSDATRPLSTVSRRVKTDIRLFCTPALRGLNSWLPERANEIIGVQHIKFAIFDNTVVLTGANLNDTYFTNRQDRYLRIDGAENFADYLTELFDLLSKFSFKVQVPICESDSESVAKLHRNGQQSTQAECVWDNADELHPNFGDLDAFRHNFRNAVDTFTQRWQSLQSSETANETEVRTKATMLVPAVHFGLCQVSNELFILKQLLNASFETSESQVVLASPYLNLVDDVIDLIRRLMDSSKDNVSSVQGDVEKLRFVFAAMTANSFHNSAGFSKYIPHFYVALAKRFLRRLSQRQPVDSRVAVYEYDRPDWTFHAKGVWHLLPSGTCNLTLLGSSNFGFRSLNRDLELLFMLHTEDARLSDALFREQARLFDTASRFKASAQTYEPLWFKAILPMVRRYL